MKQVYLLKNILDFTNKSRPRSKKDKENQTFKIILNIY